MKRLIAIALALFCASSFATTPSPVSLLSTAGSTSGQAIVSPGPAGPAGWGNVSAAALTGITPAINGGTGVTTAAAELARIGAGSTASPLSQFASTTSAQLASVISDETGSGSAVFGTSPTIATPAITGGTISGTPISGSTGSFTTLAASSTVSGAGFTSLLAPYAPLASPALTGSPTAPSAAAHNSSTLLATTQFVENELANPPAIGAGTPGSGAFTTLISSSNSKVFAQNSGGQSIANSTATTVTGWTTVFDTNSNFVASTGVFTAPRAGQYLVSANVTYAAAPWSASTVGQIFILKNGTSLAATGAAVGAAATEALRVGSLMIIVNCAAADTITVQTSQNSGAAVALAATASFNTLSITELP
ncbi:hypothetical protein [Caballeronia sp. KNU42]